MALAILIVIVCAAAALFLIMLLIRFSQMNKAHFEKVCDKTRNLLQSGQIQKAQKKISNALKHIGWDYAGLMDARNTSRMVGITGLRSFWYKLASVVNMIPASTLDRALPGFLLFGELLEKQNKTETAYKLYEDVLGYLEGEKDEIHRISFSRAASKISARQCEIDLANNNLLTALKNHVASVLEAIHLTKLQGSEPDFRSMYPFRGDAPLKEILKKMGRPQDLQRITETVNRCVNEEQAKVFVTRAMIDITNLFTGRETMTDKKRIATKEMIQSVLEKVADKEEKEEDEGPEDDGSDVILL